MLPLSNSTPKPLLPSLDDCLLKRQIEFIRKHVKNLHVTVGYMAPLVAEAALKFGADNVIDIGEGGNASWLNLKPWKEVESPTLVITCDNMMEISIDSLYLEAQNSLGGALIVAVTETGNLSGDRITLSGKQIIGMGPSKDSTLLGSGLQVLVPSKIANRIENVSDFSEVWADLIAHKELEISHLRPIPWRAIDSPLDLERFFVAKSFN